MGWTVLLRHSSVLGEMSSCAVSKINIGPQSTKILVLRELNFPLKWSSPLSPVSQACPRKHKEGPWYGPVSSSSVHGAILQIGVSPRRKGITPVNGFELEARKEMGSFGSSTTSPVQPLKNGYCYSLVGKTSFPQVCSRIPRGTSILCYALQVAICQRFTVSRVFCSSQGEAFYEGVHHPQWGIMVIVQEQNQCKDTIVSTHCL